MSFADINTISIYQKKTIPKLPIRYRYQYVDISDISTIFSVYQPTSSDNYRIQSCLSRGILIFWWWPKKLLNIFLTAYQILIKF